ncbi:hypothetical protein MMF94_40415 [Pseudonocardia alaniniphila]|uniref:Uncharacterized protein n=1 Tax=Pseudonocardia alaniniphila TaxID=75291 RepID=A0ABS9TTW1_9PSEU|nr:hypothetical protein [Pseudonocardia alaniniphila]MCH6171985.1 hypothetical protein [Pseudonocardia alaniniphila]
MIERLAEDPDCLDVPVGREVLVAEHEHFVLPEGSAQLPGRRRIDVVLQIEADDFRADARAGALHLEIDGRGHRELRSSVFSGMPKRHPDWVGMGNAANSDGGVSGMSADSARRGPA